MARDRLSRPFRVDATRFTFLALCEIDGCRYRGMTNTRGNAWRMMARHIRRAHPGHGKDAHAASQHARKAKN